jgi:hypothetical protein
MERLENLIAALSEYGFQSSETYCYTACFAGAALRIWLPILVAFFGDFIIAYKIEACLCRVPNLVVANIVIRHPIWGKPPVLC